MKHLYTLLFVICFAPLAIAQVPGYMGKRAWVSANFNVAPALFNMNQNHMSTRASVLGRESRARGQNFLAINYRPQLTFEYLISRDVALGLSYSFVKTGTVKELASDNPEIDGIHYDILKGNTIGVHMKNFRFSHSASIAPIGYYWTLGFGITKFNTYHGKQGKVGQFTKDVMNPVITIGTGKQQVLFDRLVINSGVEFGWSFMPKDAKDILDADEMNAGEHPESLSIHHAYGSLLGYYVFNLKLAVGYLAF